MKGLLYISFFAWSVKLSSTGLCKAASSSFSHQLTNFSTFKPQCRAKIILQPQAFHAESGCPLSSGHQTSCCISKFLNARPSTWCAHILQDTWWYLLFQFQTHNSVHDLPLSLPCLGWGWESLWKGRQKKLFPPPLPSQGRDHKKTVSTSYFHSL